jgi:ribosomal protein L37E
MSLIKCTDCGHDVSDRASSCVVCGYPIKTNEARSDKASGLWSTVTQSKTPINVFALAMMACASVMGVSSTNVHDAFALKAFTYALHIFLAISGMFFATLLFCRKGLYHPQDLAAAKRAGIDNFGVDNPAIAALLICLMVLLYGLYQLNQTL